ncbi:MAG: hypothetical protein KAH72_08800 [Flavobacteriaceae bacterium]|nr:hypothetical protein [Flavobacteriaceae bacterium]
MNLAVTSYGTVPSIIVTVVIFFFALETAFAIASTTSQDFQVQRATLPLPSHKSITALNLSCLPQAVTLVTLSIAKSSSLNSFFGFWNFHHPLLGFLESLAILIV